jgi:hypothetical protein
LIDYSYEAHVYVEPTVDFVMACEAGPAT